MNHFTARSLLAWKVEKDQLHVSVTVPPNSTATVLLPASDVNAVRESGQAASAAPGVKPMGMLKGRAAFRVESGSYEFSRTCNGQLSYYLKKRGLYERA